MRLTQLFLLVFVLGSVGCQLMPWSAPPSLGVPPMEKALEQRAEVKGYASVAKKQEPRLGETDDYKNVQRAYEAYRQQWNADSKWLLERLGIYGDNVYVEPPSKDLSEPWAERVAQQAELHGQFIDAYETLEQRIGTMSVAEIATVLAGATELVRAILEIDAKVDQAFREAKQKEFEEAMKARVLPAFDELA